MKNSFKNYVELIKYSQFLSQTGRDLEEHDRNSYVMLKNYENQLIDYIHWEQRNSYFKVLQNFVDSKIDGEQFINQFDAINGRNQKKIKQIQNDLQLLNNIRPTPESKDFMHPIYDTLFTFDFYFSEDFDIFEHHVKTGESIEQIQKEIQQDDNRFRADILLNVIPKIKEYCK